MLQNGPNTYAAMLAAIADAHDHIDMETYIFEDDDAGRQFADTLLAKQREGVQVNLIRDSVGTIGTPRAFFDRLKAAGIQVVEFNPAAEKVFGYSRADVLRAERQLEPGETLGRSQLDEMRRYAEAYLAHLLRDEPEPLEFKAGQGQPSFSYLRLRIDRILKEQDV